MTTKLEATHSNVIVNCESEIFKTILRLEDLHIIDEKINNWISKFCKGPQFNKSLLNI